MMHSGDTDNPRAVAVAPAEAMPLAAEKESTIEELETKGAAQPIRDEAWLAAEKSLVRKLDFTLVPIVWVLYLFNYLDRNNIA